MLALPVSSANVASWVCWNTTAVDDDAENHETDARNDLDGAQDKFNLLWSDLCTVFSEFYVLASP